MEVRTRWFELPREDKSPLPPPNPSAVPRPCPVPGLQPSAFCNTDGEHWFPTRTQGLNVRMAKSSVQDPRIKSIYFPFTVYSVGTPEFPICTWVGFSSSWSL